MTTSFHLPFTIYRLPLISHFSSIIERRGAGHSCYLFKIDPTGGGEL